MVVVRVPGQMIWDILENSVSAYPNLDGRFATFSGLKFSFDPDQPPGKRICNITDEYGKPFDFNREYSVATTKFIR